MDSLDAYVDVDLPTEDWHETVLEDATWFAEYGVPFDLRQLPDAMLEAHLAIIRGREDRRHETADDATAAASNASGGVTDGYGQ